MNYGLVLVKDIIFMTYAIMVICRNELKFVTDEHFNSLTVD